MLFKSLEQAYYLYNYRPTVFRQLSTEGVPFLWHEYKKLRNEGMDANTAEKAVHDPRIEKGASGVNYSWMKEATLETIQGSEEIYLIPTFVHKILRKYIAIASRESKTMGKPQGKGLTDARRGLSIDTNKGLIKFNTTIGKILKGQGYTKSRQSRQGKVYTYYSIQKWQEVLKIRGNSLTLQRRRRYNKSKSMQQDTATVGGSCCESIRHKLIGMVQEWEADWLHMKFSEDYADMNCEELMDALKDLEDALRPERPNLSVDISDLIDEWIECEEDGE